LEIRLASGLTLDSQINVQKGEEELDDGTKSPSRHAAPTFGMSRITWQQKKVKLQLYAVYSSEVSYQDLAQEERGKTEIYAADANGDPYSPGWSTLNLKGSYQLSPAISLNLGLENITDQRYRPYSSGIAAAGRNFIISLRALI
ncbi:MAG: TonB-dependent receptor, partial [Saprospiraceae bacterium]|nr:TonB-dependent receptor [Saprospiraceae bacterium]